MHDARKVVYIANQIVVLGAAARNANRVAFLERVSADEVAWNLTCDDNHRDGIHHRVRNWRYHIGRARA